MLFDKNGIDILSPFCYIKITYLDSKFKPIDIRKISNDYRFLGGKAECEKYIKEMLIRKPKEKYVNRTVLRKHNLNDENMKDAKYVSSYEKVEY